MLKKKYRELNDGLGTVLIGLELSQRRLTALQAEADAPEPVSYCLRP